MKSTHLLIVSLLVLSGIGLCPAKARSSDPKQAVDRFLKAWLVSKDFAQVRQSFAQEAFSSKLILSDSCAGYINDEDRATPPKVEQKVMKFLRDIAQSAKGKSLKNILVFDDRPDEKIGQISSSSKDGYILLSVKPDDITDDEEWSYLKSKFASEDYLVTIANLRIQDDGEQTQMIVYFYWARFGRNWKIIHLGMQCI